MNCHNKINGLPTSNHFKESLGVIIIFFLLSGCVSLDIAILKENIKNDPKAGAYIEGVPFFPQDKNLCGPASLASVLAFYDVMIDSEAIKEAVYLPDLKGTLPIDILIYARKSGFKSTYYNGDMDDLKKQISLNKPVILFLNMSHVLYPKGHYIVVTGYDDTTSSVIAHSGKDKETIFSYKKLESLWGKTDHATILIEPS